MDWLTRITTQDFPWPIAAALVLVGIALTKGVDALLKLRSNRQSHDNAHITRLELRIVTLETRLDKETNDHKDCIRRTGALEGRVDQLTKDLDIVISRHDRKNLEQIQQTKRDIENLKSEMGIQEPKTGDA